MLTKTLKPHILTFVFLKLELVSFSPDLQHVASDEGWLATRAKEQLPDWCWWLMMVNQYCICLSNTTFASLPFLPPSGTEPLSFSCLQTTSEVWRAMWPSAKHGSHMTSPAPDNNRQTPNKLGRRKAGKASNVLLLSTPYLPSNFQVQWKVSWTSQEFSEVWKKKKRKKREREFDLGTKMLRLFFFHETALGEVPAESTNTHLSPSPQLPGP